MAVPVARFAASAHDLGIAESRLRRWIKLDNVEASPSEGTTSDELVRLRRELRVAKMEIEILRRASSYLAPQPLPGGAVDSRSF